MSALIRLRLEPRKAIMARAEVVWEDQPGAWRGALAKIEDTSRSGACIRMSVPISVGAKIKVKWQREEFVGIAKYCRRDEGDYVLGIQREAPEKEAIERTPSSHAVHPPAMSLSSKILGAPAQQEKNAQETPKTIPPPTPAAIAAEAIASTLPAEPVAKVQDAPEPQQKKAQELPKATPQPTPAPIATVKTAAPVAAEPVANVSGPSVQPNKNASELPTINAEAAPAPVVNKAVALPVEAAPQKTTESTATNKSASAAMPARRTHNRQTQSCQMNPLRTSLHKGKRGQLC